MNSFQISTLRLFIFIFASATIATGALTCRECKDIHDPKSCSGTIRCGQGEICETREVINDQGYQAFRIGCQTNITCNILKYAQTTFGKRQLLNDGQIPEDTPTLCHECCDSAECNADLCSKAVFYHKAVPSWVVGQSTGCCDGSSTNPCCPAPYLRGHNDTCYLLGPGKPTWPIARQYCHSIGAELLVFNSEEEHDFWAKELLRINATYEPFFWMGGVYSHAASEWEWTDLSPDHYTLWLSGVTNPTAAGDYYVYVYNPASNTGSEYTHAEMQYASTGSYPFICEKQMP